MKLCSKCSGNGPKLIKHIKYILNITCIVLYIIVKFQASKRPSVSYGMPTRCRLVVITDVSGQSICYIFNGQAVQKVSNCLTLADGTN